MTGMLSFLPYRKCEGDYQFFENLMPLIIQKRPLHKIPFILKRRQSWFQFVSGIQVIQCYIGGNGPGYIIAEPYVFIYFQWKPPILNRR